MGFGNKAIKLDAEHCLNFSAPFTTQHIQTHLPYLVIADHFGDRVSKYRDSLMARKKLQMKRSRERSQRTRERLQRGLKQNEEKKADEDEVDVDPITKPSVPEVVLEDFIVSPLQVLEALKQCFEDAPLCVLETIVQFGSLSVFTGGGLGDSRLVLRGCIGFDIGICPVLEVVMRDCIDGTLCCNDIGRMIRVYNSKGITIKCDGDCTSYRVEQCDGVEIEAVDQKKRVVFVTIASEKWRYRMVDNELSKEYTCRLKYDWDDPNASTVSVFRRNGHPFFKNTPANFKRSVGLNDLV